MRALIFMMIMSLSVTANAQGMGWFGWDSNGDFEMELYIPEWRNKIIRNYEREEIDPGTQPHVISEEPEIIVFPNNEIPGTVIVSTKKRKLYYILDEYEAFEYPISVGREGFSWHGVHRVSRIEHWPDWIPPAEMRKRRPELPERMRGGLNNPLGAVAIYLGNTLYRIHGTNDPKSIGKAESSGCFRMLNEHALHLSDMVQVGTIVKVY